MPWIQTLPHSLERGEITQEEYTAMTQAVIEGMVNGILINHVKKDTP